MNKGLLLALLISFSCASNIVLADNSKDRDRQSCEHAAKGKKKEERKAFIKGCMEGKKHEGGYYPHGYVKNDPCDIHHRHSSQARKEHWEDAIKCAKPTPKSRSERNEH